MKFKATPSLLYLLHSQLDEFPVEAAKRPWLGCTVYEKLNALPKGGGTIEITYDERHELDSLLDSIVGPFGWDTIYPGERRTGRAALRQLRG